MKYGISVLLLTAAFSAHAESTSMSAPMTYNITVQNEFGVGKQTVSAPIGGETRELKLVGGVVQITPPSTVDGPSVIKFFAADSSKPVPMHTANIIGSSGKALEIAYTLCGQLLRFQSPAPEKLEKCSAVASVSEH